MADIKITADSSDIQVLRRELVGVAKDAKSSASVFEREYAKVERILNSNAKASQAHYKSLLGLDTVSKSASKSASVFATELNKADAAIKANTNSLNQFKSSYDRSFAVEQKTLQLKQLLRQEIANGTMTVRQAGAELLNYRKALVASGLAQTGFGKAMNRSGVVTQQAGYQIGDFLVQVQSGTNVFVAFGQQATQLVGTFAMLSQSLKWVGVFSALGIAIPIITAIGAAWMRMSESNDRATKSLNAYKKAQEEANSAIKTTQDNIDKLRYGVDESYQVDLLKEQVRLRGEIALNVGKGQNYLATTTDSLDRQNMVVAEINAKTNELAARHNEITSLLGQQQNRSVQFAISQGIVAQRTGEAKAALEESLKAAESLTQEEERSASVARLKKNVFHAMANEMGAVSSAVLDSLNTQKALNAALSSGDADSFNKAMNDALAAGVKFSQLDLNTVLAMAAKNGWSLAGAMRAFWAAAQGGPLVNANPAAGPGFEGGGRNRNVIPPQKYQQTFQDILNSQSKKGGGGGGGQTQEEYLQQLIREDEQKRKLIGLSESEQSAMETEFSLREKLRDLKGSVTEEEIQSTLRQIEATNKLIEQETRREEMIKSISSTIENAFMSMVDGSKSVSDAFKGMIREILLDIYRQQVAKPFADFITGLFMANGGAFSNGSQVTAYANGGVVGSPTMFKHSGGLGLMGEAGPEAIMPLKRGSNGKLGVQVDGSQGGVVVHQTFNFSANGDDSVKKIIAQAAPQIAQMTQKQIMDSRRRGGSMKATFG